MTPDALREIKDLPGHVRQRVRRAIDDLSRDPRPSSSRPLDVPSVAREIRRLRLDTWRVIYAVSDAEMAVDVFAARKRPPYDYADLSDLLDEIDAAPTDSDPEME